MAKFPESEAGVKTLADQIKGGLATDPIFADAPVTPAQLQTALSELDAASTAKLNADAAAKTATLDKNDKLGALTNLMKTDLAWAVKVPGVTAEDLERLGWGFPDPPKELQVPAMCPNFRLHNIMGRTVDFDWDKPSYREGGKPTGFSVYRRVANAGDAWTLSHVVFGASALEDIEEFPPGTWEVGVRASNRAGEGPLSNTVTVTVG